jgi:hypothetical protein
VTIGELPIKSGRGVLVWAPEDGAGLILPDHDGEVEGDTSMGGTGCVFGLANGRYRLSAVEMEGEVTSLRAVRFEKS